MRKFTSLLAGVAALALSAGASEAADLERIVTDPNYAATISSGYIHTWTDITEGDESEEYGTFDSWFGEAAALWRPSDLINIQSDFAFHSHRFDIASGKCDGNCDIPNIAVDQWHAGGILFARDPMMGLIGIDGAVGGIDFGLAADVWRIGGRGEWFLGDMATIGGGVGYHNLDFGSGKCGGGCELDGINANAFVNFYATEDLALKAKFDYAKLDFDDEDLTIDMWSIGGEAEYLLRDWFGGGSSVFVGGRYFEQEFENGFTIEQAQFFVGFRSYFVTGGSLANHHRTNTLDNTNTLLEKVPFALAVEIID